MHMVMHMEGRMIRLIQRGCEMVSSARACHLIWGISEWHGEEGV
jgi:hypothetical protein